MNAHFGIGRYDFALSRLGDFRFDLHFGERREISHVPSPLPVRIIHGLIISGERLIGDDDALQPFDGRHRVPSRHNCTQRKSVLRRKIGVVDFVSEKNIGVRFTHRNTAREFQFPGRSFRIIESATVGAFQNYFARFGFYFRAIEQDR